MYCYATYEDKFVHRGRWTYCSSSNELSRKQINKVYETIYFRSLPGRCAETDGAWRRWWWTLSKKLIRCYVTWSREACVYHFCRLKIIPVKHNVESWEIADLSFRFSPYVAYDSSAVASAQVPFVRDPFDSSAVAFHLEYRHSSVHRFDFPFVLVSGPASDSANKRYSIWKYNRISPTLLLINRTIRDSDSTEYWDKINKATMLVHRAEIETANHFLKMVSFDRPIDSIQPINSRTIKKVISFVYRDVE